MFWYSHHGASRQRTCGVEPIKRQNKATLEFLSVLVLMLRLSPRILNTRSHPFAEGRPEEGTRAADDREYPRTNQNPVRVLQRHVRKRTAFVGRQLTLGTEARVASDEARQPQHGGKTVVELGDGAAVVEQQHARNRDEPVAHVNLARLDDVPL